MLAPERNRSIKCRQNFHEPDVDDAGLNCTGSNACHHDSSGGDCFDRAFMISGASRASNDRLKCCSRNRKLEVSYKFVRFLQ